MNNWITRKQFVNQFNISLNQLDFMIANNTVETSRLNSGQVLFNTNNVTLPDTSQWLTCQICGTKLRSLTSHIIRKHKRTIESYREEFPNSQIHINTEEQNAKISEKRIKGYQDGTIIHHMLGKQHSKETKEKISESCAGYELTTEQKEKHKLALKNYRESPEFKPSMLGKTLSIESRKKIGDNQINGKSTTYKKRLIRTLEKCKEEQLTLISAKVNDRVYLKCNVCNTEFSFTKQIFNKDQRFKNICPICYPRNTFVSNQEMEAFEFITSIYSETINQSNRTVLTGYEIDIYLPNLKLGFEYTGMYWHSIGIFGKQKDHLMEKRNLGLENGILIYTILETEWINAKEETKEKIRKIIHGESLLSNVTIEQVIVDSRWIGCGDATEQHLTNNGYRWSHFIEPQGIYWNEKDQSLILYDCGREVWIKE